MTRVLLLGLGRIAQTHLAVCDRLSSVELVAGVDPTPAYADTVERKQAHYLGCTTRSCTGPTTHASASGWH